MKALTTLLVVGMFLTTVAMADDADDVKAAVEAMYSALNNSDAEGYSRLTTGKGSVFGAGGDLLSRRDTTAEGIKNNMQATFDAGTKYNFQLRHLEVTVYGNAALATYYRTGNETARISMIVLKEGGQWQQAHRHVSSLRLPEAQSSLEGAWRIVEVTVTGPNPSTNTNPQPSLYIFTPNHYSIQLVRGTERRPQYERGQATDAEKIATFDPFTANSGTYQVSGTTITRRPIVAKNDWVMSGFSVESEFRIEGETLWLTTTFPADPRTQTQLKLARVE